ncbi:MAG TPA: hypothetical protein VFK05_21270 [Polyangiaceae bacterium]|nr:hypothetical protein [Polyangiaceae bacterium]
MGKRDARRREYLAVHLLRRHVAHGAHGIDHSDKEEPFVDTVTQLNARNPFTCAINGIQYSVANPNAHRAAVAFGKSALDPNLTTPDGLLIRQGTRVTGRSSPGMFYIANDYFGGYSFGAGDPPLNASRAMGGAGSSMICPTALATFAEGLQTVRRPAPCRRRCATS